MSKSTFFFSKSFIFVIFNHKKVNISHLSSPKLSYLTKYHATVVKMPHMSSYLVTE